MKKITALLLALCMLLAITPVLADEGPAGNWYMTLADVTAGYILLNEDGSAVVGMPSQEDMHGTWTGDEKTVTININEQSLDFAYDGTSLSSDQFPLTLTREEGKVSITLIASLMNGEEYELPEGMTDIELAAIAMNFMAEYSKLMAVEDVGGSAAPAANAELTVVKEDFRVVPSYSGFEGVYIAKLKNESDVPLYVTDGNMMLTDADGKVVGSAKYPYPTGSKYVEPGETTFVALRADMEENVEASVTKNIVTRTDGYGTDTPVTVENTEYVKGKGEYDSDTMRVTVVNNSDEPLAGIEAVLVLEDADGNLLFIATESLYRYELGPHSSLTLVSSVDNKLRDLCAEKGIEPTTVEAYAWVENNDW